MTLSPKDLNELERQASLYDQQQRARAQAQLQLQSLGAELAASMLGGTSILDADIEPMERARLIDASLNVAELLLVRTGIIATTPQQTTEEAKDG